MTDDIFTERELLIILKLIENKIEYGTNVDTMRELIILLDKTRMLIRNSSKENTINE